MTQAAREHSACRKSAKNGGDLGWFDYPGDMEYEIYIHPPNKQRRNVDSAPLKQNTDICIIKNRLMDYFTIHKTEATEVRDIIQVAFLTRYKSVNPILEQKLEQLVTKCNTGAMLKQT